MNPLTTSALHPYLVAALDAAPHGTLLLDEKGEVLYANAEIQRILSAQQLIGSRIERWLTPMDVDRLAQAYRNEETTVEITIRLHDTTSIPVAVRFAMLPQQADFALPNAPVVMHWQDLRPVRSTQEQLNQLRRRMQAALDQAYHGILLVDADARIFYGNRTAHDLLGYGQLKGMLHFELLHADDRKQSQRQIMRFMRGKLQRDQSERRYVSQEDETILMRESVTTAYDENGELLLVVIQLEDLRELKEARELALKTAQLQQLVGWFRFSIGQSNIHPWRISSDSHLFEYLDAKSWDIFGIPPEARELPVDELAARYVLPRIIPEDREKVVQVINNFTEAKEVDVTYRTRSVRGKTPMWIRQRSTRIDTGQGEALVGSTQDVTEYYLAQQEREETLKKLQQAEKASSLGRIATNIGHELRNPLAIIHTQADLLEVLFEMGQFEQSISTLQNIQEQVQRATAIIESMQILGRELKVGENQSDLQQPVAIAELCQRVADKVAERATHEGIALRTDLPSQQHVYGNEKLLESVIDHMLNNALDAVDEAAEPCVQLTLREEEAGVRVNVIDNGRGISEEQRQTIFDPFYTTKGPRGRSGLGLAVCDRIVRDHDSQIELQSEVGKGSTFSICLRICKEGA
jgi:PAS domain S-box-containing protein